MEPPKKRSKRGPKPKLNRLRRGAQDLQQSDDTYELDNDNLSVGQSSISKREKVELQDSLRQKRFIRLSSVHLKRQASEQVATLRGSSKVKVPIEYEIRLKRINIPKLLRKVVIRMQNERNVKELINQIRQIYQLAQQQLKDTSGLFKQFLPRLRGAQIDGFEGPKKLNLKLNQKREEHGLDPIDIEEHCKDELLLRYQDQEELFNQLLNISLDESLQIQRQQYETRQIRLNNIKATQFIFPTKEAMIENISLSDSLPFLDPSQSNKRNQYLKQMAEQVKSQIQVYYDELVPNNDMIIKSQQFSQQSVHQSQETLENPSGTPTGQLTEKDIFNTTLKEISSANSESIDYQNLSLLLYMTQFAISDLKNSKSKRLNNVKQMKINPYELKERLKKMII
eukprot:403376364